MSSQAELQLAQPKWCPHHIPWTESLVILLRCDSTYLAALNHLSDVDESCMTTNMFWYPDMEEDLETQAKAQSKLSRTT